MHRNGAEGAADRYRLPLIWRAQHVGYVFDQRKTKADACASKDQVRAAAPLIIGRNDNKAGEQLRPLFGQTGKAERPDKKPERVVSKFVLTMDSKTFRVSGSMAIIAPLAIATTSNRGERRRSPRRKSMAAMTTPGTSEPNKAPSLQNESAIIALSGARVASTNVFGHDAEHDGRKENQGSESGSRP